MTGGGTIVIAVLVVLNLVTFAVFGWDKLCARAGQRRVSEHALLTLMAVGGSPGGWAAMLLFRHKTQKASFRAPGNRHYLAPGCSAPGACDLAPRPIKMPTILPLNSRRALVYRSAWLVGH